MKMRKTEVLMNGDDPYGQEIKIVLTKNKVGTPFREVTTNLFFGIGFDTVAENSRSSYQAWCYHAGRRVVYYCS